MWLFVNYVTKESRIPSDLWTFIRRGKAFIQNDQQLSGPNWFAGEIFSLEEKITAMPSSPAPIRRILRRLYKTRLSGFTSGPYAMSCTKEIPKRESKGDSEKMKKFLSIALCAVMVLGILAGCGQKGNDTPENNDNNTALSGTVSTNGSTSMDKVIGALKEQFTTDNPGVTVTYDPTGSGAGIEAVKNGSTDIGLASRALKDQEKSAGLKETTVALDGIAIIVNADSKVADLTVAQIADIFTGKITDWSEVGGDPGAISCIGRESGSGTRDGFESITDTKDSCKLDQELTSTGGVIEAVAGNPNAIGYASLSAVEGKNTVKAVTVGGVACTEATVLDGSYAIQRPFVLVTKTGENLSPAAQAFFDYATSSAASQLIKAAGAVPVAK